MKCAHIQTQDCSSPPPSDHCQLNLRVRKKKGGVGGWAWIKGPMLGVGDDWLPVVEQYLRYGPSLTPELPWDAFILFRVTTPDDPAHFKVGGIWMLSLR